MKHSCRLMAVLLAALTLCPPHLHALGIAARFGDVIVENAEIGKTYNLREALKIPFGIQNMGDAEVEVIVEFEQPNVKIIKPDYLVIPDPSWLKAIPQTITIGPKSQGFFDILLTIPNDPTLNGKHFQAIIKGRTFGTGLFGVAIENTLRFSVGPGPESIKEEKRQKAMERLDFDVTPKSIYVNDVPLGTTFDVKKEQNKTIRVSNFAPDNLSVKLESVAWNDRLYKPQGYDPIPNPTWISFKKTEATVGTDEISPFNFTITVPNEPQYKGKKFAALIKTGLTSGFWLDAPVTIFFSVKE